jgi:hypothetical protein
MSNPATSLTENKAFAERIFDRIKDGLGDLMTDGELKVLLDRAVNEAFFTERTVPDGHYGTKKVPAHFVEMTRELLKAQVQEQVNAYFEANHEEIKEKVAEVLQQGIGQAVLKAIEAQFSGPLFSLQHQLVQKGIL